MLKTCVFILFFSGGLFYLAQTMNNSDFASKKLLDSKLNELALKLNLRLKQLEVDVTELKEIYELKKKLIDLKYAREISKLVEDEPWVLLGITKNASVKIAERAFRNKLDNSKFDFKAIINTYENFLSQKDKTKPIGFNIKNHVNVILQERSRNLKKKSELQAILFNMIWDVVSTLNEINKINVLGSTDLYYIEKAAEVNLVINILSSSVDMLLKIIRLFDFNNYTKSNLVKLSRLLKFASNIANIKLAIQDSNVINNSSRIADKNKFNNKRSFFYVKLVQYSWLCINKLAPYAVFARSRNINENRGILNIFASPDKLTDDSVDAFHITKELMSISEVIRKYYRYRIENANCK